MVNLPVVINNNFNDQVYNNKINVINHDVAVVDNMRNGRKYAIQMIVRTYSNRSMTNATMIAMIKEQEQFFIAHTK